MKMKGNGLAWGLVGGLAIMPPSALADAVGNAAPTVRMEAFRGRIDAIDARIVDAMADRLAVAREIGAVKRAAGWPVVDVEREAIVIAQFVEKARARGIPEATARTIIQSLIAAARAEQ